MPANPLPAFTAIANMIPNGEPSAIHVVGNHIVSYPDYERIDLTFEYLFPDKPLRVNVVLDRVDGHLVVWGARVDPLVAPLEKYYEFHFLGQDLIHYIIFAAAVLLALFNAYALAQCILMPELRFKWLWIIFILVGFGAIQYNWTDGVFSSRALIAYFPGPSGRSISHSRSRRRCHLVRSHSCSGAERSPPAGRTIS